MKKHSRVIPFVGIAAALALAIVGAATADRGGRQMKADLNGAEEVPSVSSTGTGELLARISDDASSIDYTLSYENLEGATTTQAHIHLGQFSANGGVSTFLCGGGGKPACPATGGTVTGTIIAADVIGPAGQGIAAGELDELIAAMRRGVTYANVHTDKHPGGEIRGQIK